MSSKKLEKEINDLHALVSNLSPQSSAGEVYIEIVEPAPRNRHQSKKPSKPIIPLRRPPPPPAPNFIQRAFSFVGTMPRGYFVRTFAVLAIVALVVVGLLEKRAIDIGWGLLILAVAGWSFLAALIKRWRDTGHDMRWLVTLFIPFAQFVTALFVFFTPSKKTP